MVSPGRGWPRAIDRLYTWGDAVRRQDVACLTIHGVAQRRNRRTWRPRTSGNAWSHGRLHDWRPNTVRNAAPESVDGRVSPIPGIPMAQPIL